MAFQDTFDATNAQINALRASMDSACRNGMTAIATALFQDMLSLTSVYWTQAYDPTAGFSLGTIMYTTANAITGQEFQVADLGPSPLAQFAAFLRSISYHLFCAHGANVTVAVTATGISVVKH